MTVAPVVKFMHGYFGTCIGGLKMHAFPTPVSCDRTFGVACAALYLPRRCGRLSPAAMIRDFRWSVSQRDLLASYAAIVVASGHMVDSPDRAQPRCLDTTSRTLEITVDSQQRIALDHRGNGRRIDN